jgi:hypothetical protein
MEMCWWDVKCFARVATSILMAVLMAAFGTKCSVRKQVVLGCHIFTPIQTNRIQIKLRITAVVGDEMCAPSRSPFFAVFFLFRLSTRV